MLLTAKVLLTVVILGVSVVPLAADLNRTHATNPSWTGHARYHLVWQTISYGGLGILGLCLLWIPGDAEMLRANVAAAVGLCVLGGFWAAAIGRPRYGGQLADDNGYAPVHVAGVEADLNVGAFSALAVVLVIAWVLLAIA